MQDRLMNLDEAAQMLAMSPFHLANLARRREIGCVRTSARRGSPIKFRLSAINDWIASHEQPPLKKNA